MMSHAVSPRIRARNRGNTAGLLWLLAAFAVAWINGMRPTTRDIGSGVTAECGRVLASQIPQLALGVAGCALLLIAAARGSLKRPVIAVAAALFVAWLLAAALLPGTYAWDCVN
jgi:hypothetical protein